MNNVILKTRERIIAGLEPYLPPGIAEKVTDMILSKPNLDLKIVKPRKDRLGDYRIKHTVNRHQITINWDLNRHNFLITFLHEFAHLVVVEQYGNKVRPHGKEWKKTFREIATPFLSDPHFHPVFTEALANYLKNPSASSTSHPPLMRACVYADYMITRGNN